jgi:uncharacterized membrane protein (DUF485 family)
MNIKKEDQEKRGFIATSITIGSIGIAVALGAVQAVASFIIKKILSFFTKNKKEEKK